LFGLVFVLEATLIAWFGVARQSLRFDVRANVATSLGYALIVYALVAYPMIGYALGHRYPSAPTFGVPCPTTIFTFGLMLLCPPPRPRSLIIIPAAWAVLGVSAATRLGMWEDYGLVLAAIVATIAVLVQRSGRPDVPSTQHAVAAA